jgi:hypothetical protein
MERGLSVRIEASSRMVYGQGAGELALIGKGCALSKGDGVRAEADGQNKREQCNSI